MTPERLLVNFFYAQPVGHAIEALRYWLGYHVADPELEIAVALNAATPVELAGWCPFVSEAYAIEHPFVEPCAASASRLAALPREWDWIVEDNRRHHELQRSLFPGFAGYYEATDRWLVAAGARGVAGSEPPAYVPHQRLRLALPDGARARAAELVADGAIAVMPAGSSARELYPSAQSWLEILDALPPAPVVLVGRSARDERTSTSFGADELRALLAHRARPLDAFDMPLAEQLAIVERCGLFVSPHTGFGMAAAAVGTPWLAISGGRWFEWFFNGVPFRSIIPDIERYLAFTQFEEPAVVAGRTPSMSGERIREDLPRIAAAAAELLAGEVDYETALRDYFPALAAAVGDPRGDLLLRRHPRALPRGTMTRWPRTR
jgi:hypothetical protein